MNSNKGFLESCLESYRQHSFLKAYNNTFDLVRADTEALKEDAFRLRYDVFCKENNFEKPPYEGQKLEYDVYDEHSIHYLLIHKTSGEAVGTLRVVLPNDERPSSSFPLQKHCAHPILRQDERILTLCEISRFCMAPRFRRRDRDGRLLPSYYDQDVVKGEENGRITFFRRTIPYAPAALLRGAFETALAARIMDAVWLVDTCHLTSLHKIGFPYRVLGPHILHNGGTQPIVFNIKNVLDTMRHKNPHCWDVISDMGRLQKIADTMQQNDWQDHLMDEDSWDLYYDKKGEKDDSGLETRL